MTLTPSTKKKLLEIAKSFESEKFNIKFNDLKELLGRDNAIVVFLSVDYIKSSKHLARVIRRFVRTGVLEFKKSEVKNG